MLASRRKRRLEVLRPGAWNIVRNGGKTWELPDLADDELSAQMSEKVEELLAIYAEERKRDRE